MALVVPSGILVAEAVKLSNSFSRDSHCLAGIAEVAHCSAGTGPGLEWNPDVTHRELDTAASLHDHYVVEPAKMADAEDLAIHLVEARTE